MARSRAAVAQISDDDWIQTATGRKFYSLRPRLEDIEIEDIAHALSNKCRFAGHTSRFYSVAEHSLRVSCAVPREHALAGLLHDGAEAYFGDMPTPLKRDPRLRGYREAESRLQRLIFKRFGLPEIEAPEVKEADLRLLVTEARDLMVPRHPEWPAPEGVEPLEDVIEPYAPAIIKIKFLDRFSFLTGLR